MAMYHLLRPFSAQLKAVGSQLETLGRNMIVPHWQEYYPKTPFILLNKPETLKQLNYPSLQALKLAQLLPADQQQKPYIAPEVPAVITLIDHSKESKLLKDLIPAKPEFLHEKVFVASDVNVNDDGSISEVDAGLSEGCTIWYGVKIGTNVKIGADSNILDKVTLGNNVKIGDNVTLMPGVTVEDDAVIEEGSFVETGVVIERGSRIQSSSFVGANGFTPVQELTQDDMSRLERIRKGVSLAAFGTHKLENERSLTETLRLREDIRLGVVTLDEVMELGNNANVEEMKRIHTEGSEFEIPNMEAGVFLTRRAD